MKTSKHVVFLLCTLLLGCDDRPDSEPAFQDRHAKTYRMYIERADGEAVTIRKFNGQLRVTDFNEIFAESVSLRRDAAGNLVGGWKLHAGQVWRGMVSESGQAMSLTSVDLDGTISMAMDLDGDRIADIVDIRTGDDDRFSFVTDAGREIFEGWLQGRNPLCDDALLRSLSIPGFGCPGEGGGSGSPGGATGPGANSSIRDPFADICAQYRDSQRGLQPPVMTHGEAGYGSDMNWSWTQTSDAEGRRSATVGTVYYRDTEGNHVATYKTYTYYNADGDVVRVINERVDNEGNGERQVTDYADDGTTKTESETFETEINENGEYGTSAQEHERAPEEGVDTSGTTASSSSRTNPGTPPGTDMGVDMAAWCEATTPRESGLEQAAATDPAAFALGCDEIAYAGSNPDCRIFEWARPGDFEGVTASVGGGCGPFEQPGADGTCGPASGIQRLRGHIAWLGSIDLPGIEICNPLVCNPGR